MKRGCLPQVLCLLLFVVMLIWRILGAPITSQDWGNLQTPLWQARVLLPSRMERMLLLWPLSGQIQQKEVAGEPSLLDYGTGPEDAMLKQLVQQPDVNQSQRSVAVFDMATNALIQMPLESYVCSVVAAEMPASYHLEALKAQAVAARTRVVEQCLEEGGGGCSLHPGADICTDSAHCQGFASVAACQDKWGNEFEVYRERVAQAVVATTGQIITYEGKPITVLYHAISGGTTEDAQTVFSQSLPYLVSVESKGEEAARGYTTDTSFTFDEAAALLQEAFPQIPITADVLRQAFVIGEYTPTGRVDTLYFGDAMVSGADFRKALSLRSTWFSITMDQDRITFHQRGYGHGVGMSQAGANAMAAENESYKTILSHYYQGTEIAQLP